MAERKSYKHLPLADQALLRMRRANNLCTGCRLTAEMIAALSVTLMAEWWANIDEENGGSTL